MSKFKVQVANKIANYDYDIPSQAQALPVPILKTLHKPISVPTLNNATSYIPVRCGTFQISAAATNQKVDLPLLLQQYCENVLKHRHTTNAMTKRMSKAICTNNIQVC
ncbi:unnamed protein product [Brugia pahangi]|uniref:Reverse transcriptase domain-containing protein n=1 Tax=Brugia pahangi TaxID=6280 RepID=A0A0N4TAG7_BRUPA|nr:unnamed protein product [Brugia pahangi]